MDSGVSNQEKLSNQDFRIDKIEKKPLTAHVIQCSRQTLVLLFQRKIVFAYLRKVCDDRLYERKQG
jgi:hypothetical protein